ncbi:hypothetical protein Poli38472_006083 [Pythium oligandrum]|uniref:FAD-dependent oxidoreductase domain-containing protein 1 n=1 Tax=Pythium oligandrum TaxID=41045 RepID=A0A8K1CTY1_PYTOL|nr:hypothetical protein Poli38472_006083 [Pythium oligandrum]|eukprot:TMW68615.1 hypothetical protein Poli38472_006083 [Pythium oligandrum]
MLRSLAQRSQRLRVSKARGFASAQDKYDVVIAGGGVMGTSTAYHLAVTTDLSIAVVERDPMYKWASAMLSCGGIRHQFSERANILLSQYGTEFLDSLPTRLRVEGSDDVPDIQFVEGGYLFLASEKGLHVLQENYETQRNAGAHVQMLSPEELNARFPWLSTDGVVAGTLGLKHEGWFDPWSFLVALRKKSVSLGVDFIPGDVKGFDRDQPSNRIESVHVDNNGEQRMIKAGMVVNAAGAWASKLLEACDIHDYPVRPRKRTMFSYHCRHEDTWKGSAASPLVVDPNGVYFRREGSAGQFVCGVSPNEANDPDGQSNDELQYPDHEIFEDVIWPTIANRVSKFEDIKVLSTWAGWYDYNTFDQNAIIGVHPDVPNMYLINGFSGHGLQQSPGAGRAIAELITHGAYQTIDASCFAFERVRENKPFLEKAIV